jgi:hypothetical protein
MNWRKFRRSPREILFRLRQECLNLGYLYGAPVGPGLPALPLSFLPGRERIADRLCLTPFAAALASLAAQIRAGRVPLLGFTLEASHPMPWRKDSRLGIETGLNYFRRIPYLDASRCGDHKVVWELNRHQHLVVLAQDHLLTGDAASLAVLETQLADWMDQNPFQRGINWASALEVAFRAISWLWIYHLAGDRLDPALRLRMGHCLYRHGLHLEANLSVYFSPNTHVLGEAVALDALGRLFGVDSWCRRGGEVVDTQLAAQVLPDGAHFEQSTYYHVYALDFFVFHALLAGKTDTYEPVLRRMGRYLEALLGTAGLLPLIGDDDGGRLFHPYGRHVCHGRATLSTLGLLYREPRWVRPETVPEQAAWWLDDPVLPAAGREDSGGFLLFPATGKAILNTGPLSLVLDAGPFGPYQAGHSHAGCLAVLLRWEQEEVFLDPGTYVYVGDPASRERFRGVASHNTIAVAGLSPAVPNGPFGWHGRPTTEISQTGPAAFLMRVRYGGLLHQRKVSVDSGGMQIEDFVEYPPAADEAVMGWQCGAKVEAEPEGWWRIGTAVRIHLPGAALEPSFRSTAYGRLEPAWALRLRLKAQSPVRLLTRIEWPVLKGPWSQTSP